MMLHKGITDERDMKFSTAPDRVLIGRRNWRQKFALTGDAMMKLETTNRRDWQGFTRILEVMSLVDDLESRSPEEIRESVESFCELPPNPGQTMSMEEVVFWSGVSCGMEFWRHAEEGTIDPATAEKMLVFASIFGHSMKNAIVDLALGDLETGSRSPWAKLSRTVGR